MLHWLMIVLVHLMVFWVFPISGNENLQGKKWCDEEADIQCN